MAFQAVLDTAEINMIFSQNGVTVQNTHYARLPGGYNQIDLQALADKIDTLFLITFVTEVTNETIYLRTEVRGLANENDLVATQNAGTAPGTHTGNNLPNNVTFAIKKSSGLTGRSARGRIFWIGVPRTELDGLDENLLIAAYAAQIVADIDFIRVSIATVGLWEPVLVSRFTNGAKRPTGTTFPWISTSNVDLIVDTHRGRLPAA